MGALSVIETGSEPPSLALELPERTTFEQWVVIGRGLCLTERALNWHIGDWWAFGDHRYGERARAAAEGIFGREFQTLRDIGWVASSFETSRRHDALTFQHHREVASLPANEADALLEKAEREHLSTRDLRREVQALRVADDAAADDDAMSASDEKRSPHGEPELLRAYEAILDLSEELEEFRPLTRGERIMLELAETFVRKAYAGRSSKVPDDFDVIFVEQGRDACESWYRASKKTVTRWLRERGKKRLAALRADFISHQRSRGKWMTRSTSLVEHHETRHDEAPVWSPEDDPVAKAAANFLRVSRYGGWRVSPAGEGEWFVGTVRKTSAELIAMAECQGFDREAVGLQCDGGEAVERSS
jgi:hypothetical protein